jgi:5,5'-dehydrodivanillate O-demethylase oxygenase subunit
MSAVDYIDCFPTGPGTIAGQYMRKFWHPVHRAEDLQPGWAKPLRIMSEDFTLYRGEDGTPRAVAFRCPHRGAQLSSGWVEGDCIRCRFHGWKFDASGQCVEQPAENESFADKVRIRSYPSREYLSFIFVYFGEGDPPPLPGYPDFENHELWTETYMRPCNFLNNIENDPVHIPFTHRESEFFLRRPREIPAVAQEETEWGLMLTTTTSTGRVQYLHYGMPNVLLFKESDRDHIAWRVPIDDEHHASFQLDVQHVRDGIEGEAVKARHAARSGKLGRSPNELGAAVLRGDIRIQDLAGDDKANIVWVQDYAVQVGQGPIELRQYENLGRSDIALILQRKIWVRELQALADGNPLTPWTRTERLAELRSYSHVPEEAKK